MKIIKQGAEAVIKLDKNKIIKERIKKNYRIKQIDEKLRKFRTRREGNILRKAVFTNVPKIYNVDDKNMIIEMEYIKGMLLKDFLNKNDLNKILKISNLLGNEIALLHDHEIIHGDLTTTNLILKDEKIYFIDFGLAFISHKSEDKAVDLYLLKQALTSSFPQISEQVFNIILQSYHTHKQHHEVLERLKKVEKRGRYKNAQ